MEASVWNADSDDTTSINGEDFEFTTATQVVAKVKEIARAKGFGKFDVKDADGELVNPSDIVVGGDYKIVPRAEMGA